MKVKGFSIHATKPGEIINTFIKAVFVVAASALLFCFIGSITGFSLGHFAPDYYRTVFAAEDLPDFNPVQVGIGLGVTQGLTTGVIVGLLIIFMKEPSLSGFRDGIKALLWKHKRRIIVTISCLAILYAFADWQLRKFGNGLILHAYTDYVSREYMSAQRRKTKKWPTNLNKLVEHVRAEEDYSRANRYLNDVLDFHNDSFERIEMISHEDRKFVYRLHLKGYTVRCNSTVNLSGFDDGSCTYEQ